MNEPTAQKESAPEPEFFGPSLSNDGGPLLVLPRSLVSSWGGAPEDDPMTGDYSRACEVEGSAVLLSVGEGHGVVLANDDHCLAMRWVRHGDAWIVGGDYTAEEDLDAELLGWVAAHATDGWTVLADRVDAAGGLVLLHAATPGDDLDVIDPAARESAVGGWSGVPVPAEGAHRVEHAQVKLGESGFFVLCRFTPVD